MNDPLPGERYLQTLTPGTKFDRYEILSLLALGGMAEVWLAVRTGAAGFRKRLAIKTLLPALAGMPTLVPLFVREAELAAEVDHPGIVQVFDFGEVDARYFLAMEYLHGTTLRDLQQRLRAEGRRAPLSFSLRAVARVCDALQYLHDFVTSSGVRGVVHNDMSPENVMVTSGGAVKVLDFGGAEVGEAGPACDTVVAKVRYIAPERIEGRKADRRSDVYSLGVILYELATGSRPCEGDEKQVMTALLRGQIRDPRTHDPDIPEEIARIIMAALARDPSRRYPEAAQLGEELLRVARSHYGDQSQDLVAFVRPYLGAEGERVSPEGTPPVSIQSRAPNVVATDVYGRPRAGAAAVAGDRKSSC